MLFTGKTSDWKGPRPYSTYHQQAVWRLQEWWLSSGVSQKGNGDNWEGWQAVKNFIGREGWGGSEAGAGIQERREEEVVMMYWRTIIQTDLSLRQVCI